MKKFTLVVFVFACVFAQGQEGLPDPAFGTNSNVTTIFSDLSLHSTKAVFDETGGLVGVKSFGSAIALIRYNSDGAIDYSFNGGIIIHDFSTLYTSCTIDAICIQPDGRIVVAASARLVPSASHHRVLLLLRFNNNGTVDADFGKNGVVQQMASDRISVPHMAIQHDGTIVNSLQNLAPGGSDFLIRLVDNNGNSITKVGAPLPPLIIRGSPWTMMRSLVHAISIQHDGKIVVAAQGFDSDGTGLLILERLNADGKPDASFGTNGVVLNVNIQTRPETIAVQSDGRIIVEGENHLYRFNADGPLDPTFGNNGVLISPFNVSSVFIQPDDKLVTGGDYNQPGTNGHFLLSRYDQNGSSFDHSFGYGGITVIALSPVPVNLQDLKRANNRIYAYGSGFIAAFQTSSTPAAFDRTAVVQSRAIADKINDQKLTALVSPNPATSHFLLRLQSSKNQPVQVKVYDAAGRTMEWKRNVLPGNVLRFGDNFRPGMYYAEIVQGSEKQTVKMIKSSR
jgi:uncharacterized delta-60 repeat protein